MTMNRKERLFWVGAFIDGFSSSTVTVYEVGKMTYKSVASARNAYNNYIRESQRENKIKVMTRGEKVFLYKV